MVFRFKDKAIVVLAGILCTIFLITGIFIYFTTIDEFMLKVAKGMIGLCIGIWYLIFQILRQNARDKKLFYEKQAYDFLRRKRGLKNEDKNDE